MESKPYANCVFLNCPFDEAYKPVMNAIIFAIYDCGFTPRCAMEVSDSSDVRIDKIAQIIADCKLGVHDISRTELDDHNDLPRFNMPFELGIFMGAKKFGDDKQRTKRCLVLDRAPYRYHEFISDISGQDIRSHNADPSVAISEIRSWLNSASSRQTIPGGREIARRYDSFCADLRGILDAAKLVTDEVTINDYFLFIENWLTEDRSSP